jgi:CDP-diacylglycerol--serine O-phosphatidyltransferase
LAPERVQPADILVDACRAAMKRISMLPNVLTLANAGCGLLAISKGIDALALGVTDPGFNGKLESACWLIALALVLDGLDGKLARLLDSFSDFGAQLDSFADAITFGVAPAMIAKVMLEGEGLFHPRLNFFVAASYALMAVLRLARFNLESDHEEGSHKHFAGLPSPAAAGILAATILMCLSLSGGIEGSGAGATPVGRWLAVLPAGVPEALTMVLQPAVFFLLPALGLLMVSRVRYPHAFSALFSASGFPMLVRLVFLFLLLYLAPVPVLFCAGYIYLGWGLWNAVRNRRSSGAKVDERRAA